MKLIRNGQEIGHSGPETAQNGPENAPQGNGQPDASTAKKAFLSHTGRNYNAMYRAAVDLHKTYYPPVIGRYDDDAVDAYWRRVSADMQAKAEAFGNDPFAVALFVAVFEELEREYNAASAGLYDGEGYA